MVPAFMAVAMSGGRTKITLREIHREHAGSSQAIVYSCFTIVIIFAPAAVSILGPTVAMFVGGMTYL